MASLQQLKARIGSVKNTKQITKAMEMVAASKMRRAQERALRSRDYKEMGLRILSNIHQSTDVSINPLHTKRTIKTRLLVVVTSDRGLAGAYNSHILRLFLAESKKNKDNGVTTKAIVFGKKGSLLAAKLSDVEVIAAYNNFPENPLPNDIRPILNELIELYEKKQVDAIDLIFTTFKSRMVQQAIVEHFLPAAFDAPETDEQADLAMFEPSIEEVLETVTQRLLDVQLSQALFESQASEHSMRMMAMKSATDNASDLQDDLTLEFNTVRQAAITQEIAEITGGAAAVSA